jgi:hypothetical protein
MNAYIRTGTSEAAQIDDDWIILHTSQYTVTTLNAVGGYCWGLLEQQQTTASLKQAVHDAFICDDFEVEKDLEVFISELLRCGLIENVS